MTETLTTIDQTRTETGIPSEQGHWYAKDGTPYYQVEAKNGGMRNTTLADARKFDFVPSVTNVLNVAAKPGLEIWKANQILDSALTLPMMPGELADDYKKRVILDAGEKSKKAQEKGTELHAAIETYIRGTGDPVRVIPDKWEYHIINLEAALVQMGIDLFTGKAEHSFASPLGYGGKIDFHNDEPLIIDFKTTEHLNKKQLVWPEHVQQLAAYGFGVFGEFAFGSIPITPIKHQAFRAINVFVGTEDKQVRVFEHEWSDIVEAFECFKCLLSYWQRIKKFGPYAKDK